MKKGPKIFTNAFGQPDRKKPFWFLKTSLRIFRNLSISELVSKYVVLHSCNQSCTEIEVSEKKRQTENICENLEYISLTDKMDFT